MSFSFDVVTREIKNELIISKNSLQGTIPQLNNEDPLNVSVTGNAVTYSYDVSTRRFEADQNATLDNTGKITKKGYSDEYNGDRIARYRVYVEYPIDAYKSLNGDTVELKVPASAYYEGYNNNNSEFVNPYKSDTVQDTIVINFKNPTGNVAIFDVTVGDYIREPFYRYAVSKKNPLEVYNGVSSGTSLDRYVVAWKGSTGTGNTGEKMIMKDSKIGEAGIVDQFIKKDSSLESMENFITNYGICFSNPAYLLGDNGWIKVYNDESNELLVTFDSSNWNKYSVTYPYSYNSPVKHIRIETSETKENQSLIVYNIKNINNEYLCNNYTREQFNEFIYIKSTLSGYIGDNYINTDVNQANYEEPISIANVSVSPTSMSTQTTEKNVKISIKSKVNEVYNEEKWANGIFLIKLPSTIIDTDINSVISNVKNNKVISFDKYVESGNQFIKIITESTANDIADLTIDLNLTADPRIQTTTDSIELYAVNENCENYYSKRKDVYDINNNSNTEELVNYDSAYLNLISPNSLLTSEIARNYNDKNESIVAPQIAIIDKETNSATIDLNIKNNYTSTISEVTLLGRVPFEGNKYVVQGKDLGSNFTTSMNNTGIQIPDNLKQYAKVYYSENEEATRYLQDLNNGWTENPSDFSKIKSYLITLGDYQVPQNASYTFSYSINIPNGLDYNKIAYSHHAVYFSLDTDEGKYRTYTEPNKLGFMIAKQYNLKVTKYQTDTDKNISGAIYSLNESGITNDTRTRATDNNGKFNINNIYAEKVYVLKEVKSPLQYALNSKEIKFKVEINDDGKLVPILVSGDLRKNTELIISKDETDDYELQIQVEDDVRPNLKIVKTEKDTDNRIANIKFRIKGNGLPSDGKILTTNQNGEVDITGLYLNSSYNLEEISNDGYIKNFKIYFTITKDGENYKINISQGSIKGQSVEIKNDIPEITMNIEYEKSPRFTLDITKTKKGDSSFAIAGAKFQLYRNNQLVGNYVSDENGKIVIEELEQTYSYKVNDWGSTSSCSNNYILKEVEAPSGFAKIQDIKFYVQTRDGELKFYESSDNPKEYSINENVISLKIEDAPSFKLTKIDGETKKVLPNTKFALYNVQDDMNPAKDSKGNILGTKEVINGKEYYVVATDEKGEITADLKEGRYKAVEVYADEKYDISNSIYYFNVGEIKYDEKDIEMTSYSQLDNTARIYGGNILNTLDNGYLIATTLSGTATINNQTVTSNGGTDILLVKYNENDEIEWFKDIGGTDYDRITNAEQLTDGSYLISGYYGSDKIEMGDITITNSTTNGNYDFYVIKCNSSGDVVWADSIGGDYNEFPFFVTSTSDGGFIGTGSFYSPTININGQTIKNSNTTEVRQDGIIVKYNKNCETEWYETITGEDDGYPEKIIETKDGNYIVSGTFMGTLNIQNSSITSCGSDDIFVAKIDKNGKPLWLKDIGSSSNESFEDIIEKNDGKILVGFYAGDDKDFGNDIRLIKGYNIAQLYSGGSVKNIDILGFGSNLSGISNSDDGGYIAYGATSNTFSHIDPGAIFVPKKNSLGWIIKWNENGEIEYTSSFGQVENAKNAYHNSFIGIIERKDGSLKAIYDMEEENITENGFDIENKSSSYNLLILKYAVKNKEKMSPKITNWKYLHSSAEITALCDTKDGGYIFGGDYSKNKKNFIDDKKDNTEVVLNTENDYYSGNNGVICKYNESSKLEWYTQIEGKGSSKINSIIETEDGFIVSETYNGQNIIEENVITSEGENGTVLIKYTKDYKIEWIKKIKSLYVNSMIKTQDSGFILAGSFDEDVEIDGIKTLINKIDKDACIVKFNSNGELEWARSECGEIGDDEFYSIIQDKDGGFLVSGYNIITTQKYGGIYKINCGIVIKYNSNGDKIWSKTLDGNGSNNSIRCVSILENGDYVLGISYYRYFKIDEFEAGERNVYSGDDSYDTAIVILDRSGNVKSTKTFGEIKSEEYPIQLISTRDGGFLLAGYFGDFTTGRSFWVDNVLISGKSGYDGMVIKFDKEGTAEWGKVLKGEDWDYVYAITQNSQGRILVAGQSYQILSETSGRTYDSTAGGLYRNGFILELLDQSTLKDSSEITVENKVKEFKITTDVEEVEGIKGGTISGENETPYEIVKYGKDSSKEIKMIPDENYEIIKITVNGEEYPFTKADDGSFAMPIFTDMTEDKHIVVRYVLKDNKITINKVDSETKEKLAGAKFKIEQVDENSNGEPLIGELTDNGKEYDGVNFGDEVTDKLGELTDNGTYYFIKNADGTYVPTNSKTYQTANGGSNGINSSTANSYMLIDLTDLSGTYGVVVNASCSSEGSYDIGYATISENVTAPSYNDATDRFMYISGTKNAIDYSSSILEGGKKYYLHLGYRKDASSDSGSDQVIINSVKLYNMTAAKVTYNFINNNGKYESTNQEKDNTVANSYIPIDLTKCAGIYGITVNAEISSYYGDYGYVTITEDTTRPEYDNSTGRFVYIDGKVKSKNYKVLIEAGKMYYLHMGYYKNASNSSGDDKFTINSISVKYNSADVYNRTLETDSNGQATAEIPFGKYKVTEILAPDGYWKNETPLTIDFKSGGDHEFTIEDEPKANVIVHHYLKGTATKVADDESIQGKIGEKYTTEPHLDLDKYTLERNESGNYVVPDNATGNYEANTQEVIYYYVEKQIPLIIHHYIEGTTKKVPLADGGTAEDEYYSGKEGETYTTNAKSGIDDKYKLVSVPDNANGTYSGSKIEVTYYYKVQHQMTITKVDENTNEPLRGVKFAIGDWLKQDVTKKIVKNDTSYYFENVNGRYESNNAGKAEIAKSYVLIDLRKLDSSKSVRVNVNAEISSYSSNYGYAYISNSTTATYYWNVDTFMKISGEVPAKDYSTFLQGGKIYYLHLGYYNRYTYNSGTDKMIINKIEIIPTDYQELTTDEDGKITFTVDDGIHKIEEIQALDGYSNQNAVWDYTPSKAVEKATLTNQKLSGTVVVHHYIEGTETPVPLSDGTTAQDETLTGDVGAIYTTTEKKNISDKYQLVAIPSNGSGEFTDGKIEVTYYYKLKDSLVLVHHYLEGTTDKLKDDERIVGDIDSGYTTSEATDLLNRYELVSIPENKTGTFTDKTIEVTYYYRLINTSVIVHHYKEETTEKISQDVTITGNVDDTYSTKAATDIPAKYELVEVPANASGKMTKDPIEVIYYYRLKNSSVLVHHYKEGTTEKLSEDVEQLFIDLLTNNVDGVSLMEIQDIRSMIGYLSEVYQKELNSATQKTTHKVMVKK